MQYVEATGLGVRAVVWVLRHRDTPLRFHLFSMVHIGTRDFYDEVAERVGRCDLIVAEGWGQSSRRLAPLRIRAYRLLRRVRNSDLVYQDIDYAALGVPVVWPDTQAPSARRDGSAGRERPERPVVTRLLFLGMLCLLPLRALYTVVAGNRRFMAWAMRLNVEDDTPTLTAGGGVDAMVLDDRDDLLIDALDRIHEERAGEAIDVAVVYGAMHMPAVVHHLYARYGYQPGDGEWLIVHGIGV